MEQRFYQFCLQEKLLPAQGCVLVAVSGGVDSMALLHLFKGLVDKKKVELVAAHLDHNLCAESGAAATFVADHCAKHGVRLIQESITVPADGRGVEAVARDLRYAFLRRVAQQQGCKTIAVAHHLDDQAETVLYRLARGTGVAGLAAMKPRSADVIRPLLFATRQEIVAWATQNKVPWMEDPGNRNPRYDRNHLRHHVMPDLHRLNGQVTRNIGALAAQVDLEEGYWLQQVQQGMERALLQGDRDDAMLRLSRSALLAMHPALALRVLRAAAARIRGTHFGFSRAHSIALMDLLGADQPQQERALPGMWAARRYDQLWLRAEAPAEPPPFDLPVQPDKVTVLPDGRRLVCVITEERLGENATACELDPVVLTKGLHIRSWRAGDRIHLPHTIKLQDLFVNLKLSHERRRTQPVIVSGNDVLWLPEVRRSVLAPAKAVGAPCLYLRWQG